MHFTGPFFGDYSSWIDECGFWKVQDNRWFCVGIKKIIICSMMMKHLKCLITLGMLQEE